MSLNWLALTGRTVFVAGRAESSAAFTTAIVASEGKISGPTSVPSKHFTVKEHVAPAIVATASRAGRDEPPQLATKRKNGVWGASSTDSPETKYKCTLREPRRVVGEKEWRRCFAMRSIVPGKEEQKFSRNSADANKA
jgi:hypothetical protein